MLSFKSIMIIATLASSIDASGVTGVASIAAPLVAPAQVGYAHAVPDNVPPYAAQVNIESRAVNLPYASYVAPYPASYVSPYALPGSLASYTAPYPYSAQIVRSPFGLAPAFVR